MHTRREVWSATLATFGAKLVMALTFVVPVLLLDLEVATIVSIVWGAIALSGLSYSVARRQGDKPGPVVVEHLAVGSLVVVAALLIGRLVAAVFGDV